MWTTPPYCLISGQQKGILNVIDSDILTGNKNSDHIESILELWCAVSIDPHARTAAEFSAFAEVHGFHWVAEGVAATRLDLDERDLVSASHDEVDIAVSAAKAMRDKLPSCAAHPPRGDSFAQQPECLSLFRHGLTLSRSDGTCVTRSAQANSNERGA